MALAIQNLPASIRSQAELLEKLPPAFKEIRGEILKFLAEEFTRKVRNNYDYKISAAYCDLIFELGIDAIMFPSVQAEGLSFNIAIKKETVDQCLECDLAVVTKSKLVEKDVIIDYYLISEIIGREGELKWKEPPAKTTTSNFEMKMIRKQIEQTGSFNEHRIINKKHQ